MAQGPLNPTNRLIAVNKILPDIDYFLRNDLSKEVLSDFSNERRLELLRRLEELTKPPNLPPRKQVLKRVNTGGQIGSQSLVVTPETKRKLSDGILSTSHHVNHDATAEFIKIQREISRKWGQGDIPESGDISRASPDNLEEQDSVVNTSRTDSVSSNDNSNIYERILSDDSSVSRDRGLSKAVENKSSTQFDGIQEEDVAPPPVPDRTGRGNLRQHGKGWVKTGDKSTDSVLVHSLKEPAYSGPLKDLRSGEKLWGVLKNFNLYFFRSLVVPAHEILNMLEYDIHIDNVRRTMFRLNKPGFPSFLLATDNEGEFDKWIEALERCKYEQLHKTPTREVTDVKDLFAKVDEGDGEDGYERPEELLKKFEEKRNLKLRQQEYEKAKGKDAARSPSDCYVDMSGNAGKEKLLQPDYELIDPPSPDYVEPGSNVTQYKDSYYETRSLPPIPGDKDTRDTVMTDHERRLDTQSDDNSLSGSFESLESDDGDAKSKSESVSNLLNQSKNKKLQEKKGKEFDFFHDLDAVYCGILHQRRILAVWQKRYCKIKDGALICRRSPDEAEKPVLEVSLAGCKLELAAKETRRTTAFKLRRANDDILYFAAETRDHLMKWITVLARAIDKDRQDKTEISGNVLNSDRAKRHSETSNGDTNSIDSREYQIIDDFCDAREEIEEHNSESDFDADTESSSDSDEEGADREDQEVKTPKAEFGTVKSKIIRKLRKKNRMSGGSSDDLEDTDADIRGYLYRFQSARWSRKWCVIRHKKFFVHKKASVHHPELCIPIESATLLLPTDEEQARINYNLFKLVSVETDPLLVSSTSRTDCEVWKSILLTLVKTVCYEGVSNATIPPPPWYRKKSVENGTAVSRDSWKIEEGVSRLPQRKSADVSTLNVNGKMTEIKYKSGKPNEVERWFSVFGRDFKIFESKEFIDPILTLELRNIIIRRMKVEDQNMNYLFSIEFMKDGHEQSVDFKMDRETQNTLTPVLWASEAQLVGFDTMTLDRRKKWSVRGEVSMSLDANIEGLGRNTDMDESRRARSEDATLHESRDSSSEMNVSSVVLLGRDRRKKASSVPESILQVTLPGTKDQDSDFSPRSRVRASAVISERQTTGNRMSRLFKSLTSDRRHKKHKSKLAKENEERQAKYIVENHPKAQFHGDVDELKTTSDGGVERIRRHCRISGKIFYAYEVGNLLKPIFKVPLRNAVLEDRVDSDAKLYTISVTSMDENTEFTFALPSEQDLEFWLVALCQTESNTTVNVSSKESLLSDDVENRSKDSDVSAHDQADGVLKGSTTGLTSPTAESDESKPAPQERKTSKTKEEGGSLERIILEDYLFESKSSDLTTTKVRQWIVLRKTALEIYDKQKGKRARTFPFSGVTFSVGNSDDKREKLKLILKTDQEILTLIANDEMQHQKWARELKRLTRRRTRVGSDSAKSLLKSTSGSLKQLLVKIDSGKSKRATLLLDDNDQEAVEKYVDFLNPVNTLSGPLTEILEDSRTKERFCVIRDGYFHIFKGNKPEKKVRKINLATVTVLDESDPSTDKYLFRLEDGKGKSTLFECQDHNSADRWMVAVSMAMLLDKLQFGESRSDVQKSASDYEFLTLTDGLQDQGGCKKDTQRSSSVQETVGVKRSSLPKKEGYRKVSSADNLLSSREEKSPSPPLVENISRSLSDLTLVVLEDERASQREDGGSNGDVKDSCGDESVFEETSLSNFGASSIHSTPMSSVSTTVMSTESDRKSSTLSGSSGAETLASESDWKEGSGKVDDLLRNKEILESERYTLQRCLSELKSVVDDSRVRRRQSRTSASSPQEATAIEKELRTAKNDFQKLKKRLAFVDKELKKVNNEIHRRCSRNYLKYITSTPTATPSKWYAENKTEQEAIVRRNVNESKGDTADEVVVETVDPSQDFII